MPRRFLSLPAIVAVTFAVVASALPAVAEDTVEAKPKTPRERFERATADLPAPSALAGFPFEGDMLMEDLRVGGVKVEIEATTHDGKPAWRLRESAEAAGAYLHELELVLTPDLRVLAARGHDKDPDKGERWYEIKPDEKGYVLTRREVEGEPEDLAIDYQGAALPGMVGGILFSRLRLDKPGVYEFVEIDDNPDEGDPTLNRFNAEIKPVGDWEGQKAVTVTFTRKDDRGLFAFHPLTGVLLGVDTEVDEGVVLKIRPKSSEPIDASVLDSPANTPEVAAARCLLALASQDMELFEESMHWPTALETLRGQDPTIAEFGDDELKELLLGQIALSLRAQQSAPKAVIAPMLMQAIKQPKKKELDDGKVAVTMPKSLGGTVLVTKEIDGVWYVVRFPGT